MLRGYPPPACQPKPKRQAAKPLRPLAPHKANALKNYRQRLSFGIYVTFANRKEVLFMSTEEKQIKVEQASKLAKWFKISIEISIFGHVIFSKTWPPQD